VEGALPDLLHNEFSDLGKDVLEFNDLLRATALVGAHGLGYFRQWPVVERLNVFRGCSHGQSSDAASDRDECRGPSTPQNDSLRESFCYAQDDNLELI